MKKEAFRRVRVYVGGSTRSGLVLDTAVHQRWVRRVSDVLAALSGGGCTVYPTADGCWRGAFEPVQIVEAVIGEGVWSARRFELTAVLQHLLAATCQDAVLVTADYLAPDEVSFVTCHDGEGVVSSCG